MKQEDIYNSIQNIKPNDDAINRMYRNITSNQDKKVKNRSRYKYIYRVIPAFALVLFIVGGSLLYKFIPSDETREEDLIGEIQEDYIAIISNQFQIEDRHYMLLSEELRDEYALSEAIQEKDIGNKIITITRSIDSSLMGKDVYEYLPAGGEAVVAVKLDSEYRLFRFLNFESYINNRDEDVIEYLRLYGIYRAEDIAKIQFLGHSEEAKIANRIDIRKEITDPDQILIFYNFYSVIRDSSTQYFDELFHYQPSDQEDQILTPENQLQQPPEQKVADDQKYELSQETGGEIEESSTGSSVQGSPGSVGDALSNSVTIRIYNQHGIYYDTEYYPNLGFISRHEVKDDFAAFLEELMN